MFSALSTEMHRLNPETGRRLPVSTKYVCEHPVDASNSSNPQQMMHALDYDRALGELLELDDTIRASIERGSICLA